VPAPAIIPNYVGSLATNIGAVPQISVDLAAQSLTAFRD
jgi:hypothetical protein